MILLILGAMWAGVGISWLRSRSGPRKTNSISAFSNHLTVLARTSPARSSLPAFDDEGYALSPQPVRYTSAARLSRRQAQKRRRDVLVGLLAASGLLLVLAVVAGGIFVPLTAISLALLGGYVALLVRMQKMVAERQAKVRFLPQVVEESAVDDHQVLMLHRSAN